MPVGFSRMATKRSVRAGSASAAAAGVVGCLTCAAIVAINIQQGDDEVFGIFSAFLPAVSALSIGSALPSQWSTRVRLILRGSSAGGFLAAGMLGLLSIGWALVVAGLLCVYAWIRLAIASRPVPPGAPLLSVIAAIGAGSVLILSWAWSS